MIHRGVFTVSQGIMIVLIGDPDPTKPRLIPPGAMPTISCVWDGSGIPPVRHSLN